MMICEKCRKNTDVLYARLISILKFNNEISKEFELKCRNCSEDIEYDYAITDKTVEYAKNRTWIKINTEYDVIILEESLKNINKKRFLWNCTSCGRTEEYPDDCGMPDFPTLWGENCDCNAKNTLWFGRAEKNIIYIMEES